jgi:hypothetical protein
MIYIQSQQGGGRGGGGGLPLHHIMGTTRHMGAGNDFWWEMQQDFIQSKRDFGCCLWRSYSIGFGTGYFMVTHSSSLTVGAIVISGTVTMKTRREIISGPCKS